MPSFPVVFTNTLPEGSAITVTASLHTQIAPKLPAASFAVRIRSFFNSEIELPKSLASSPMCGVRISLLQSICRNASCCASKFKASASNTIPSVRRFKIRSNNSADSSPHPSPGPIAMTSAHAVISAISSSDGTSSHVVSTASGTSVCTIGRFSSRVRIRTRPAPVARIALAAKQAAPAIFFCPATSSTLPNVPLLLSRLL